MSNFTKSLKILSELRRMWRGESRSRYFQGINFIWVLKSLTTTSSHQWKLYESWPKKTQTAALSQPWLTLSTSCQWEVIVQSSLPIRYKFRVNPLSLRHLTMFWGKESDFTFLEICILQQKMRSQSQKFIRLYTLFQNNNRMIRYICPSLPTLHPHFGKLARIDKIKVRIWKCNNCFTGGESRSLKCAFYA